MDSLACGPHIEPPRLRAHVPLLRPDPHVLARLRRGPGVATYPSMTLGEGVILPWSGAHVADFFTRLLGALGDAPGSVVDL